MTAVKNVGSVFVVGFNYRGYDEQIQRELLNLGIPAVRYSYVGNVPSNGKYGRTLRSKLFTVFGLIFFLPQLLRFNLKLRRKLMEHVDSRIIAITPAFLFGFMLPKKVLDRSLIWMMDPLSLYPLCNSVYKYFGTKASYDYLDASRTKGVYLPLFADGTIYQTRHDDTSPGSERFLFAFVGAVYQERILLFEHLCRIAEEMGRKVYFGGVVPRLNRVKFDLNSGKYPFFRKFFMERLHTHEEIASIYQRSDLIINTHKEGHNGLSMRTFEALRLNRPQVIDIDAEHLFRDSAYKNYFLKIDCANPPTWEVISSFLALPRSPLKDFQSIALIDRVITIKGLLGLNSNLV